MKLSTKGRYAVTAMMDLAIHHHKGPVTLADISLCQGISQSYLEQLFTKLRRAGLVRGMRGPGGGYQLAMPPEQITVARIIDAVDESIDVTQCGGQENCQKGERCLTHELWTDLSKQLHGFLEGITLATYAKHPVVQEVADRQDNTFRRGLLHRSTAA